MLYPAKTLDGLTLGATDGEIGRVSGFLVDEDNWTIRYLVVSTSAWLGREVVISPVFAGEPDWEAQRLDVSLTRDQVRNSPDLLSTLPVTRGAESAYAAYYGYPAYWGGPGLWGWAGYPGALASGRLSDPVETGPPEVGPAEDPDRARLHEAAEVRGIHLEARDGDIGHVDDAIVDARSWALRYFLVDTSNWIGGRHVLVPARWVTGVRWLERKLAVDVTRQQVQSAPEFDPARPLDQALESALDRHYEKRMARG
jgi:hypothetical protein